MVYFINKYVQSVCAETQIFWVSDGGHSVHVMSALNIESSNGDNEGVLVERELATIKLSGSGICLVLKSYIFSVKYIILILLWQKMFIFCVNEVIFAWLCIICNFLLLSVSSCANLLKHMMWFTDVFD
jgi:hypothetical protein